MSDGRGCWCCAAGPFECVCDADWTPQEIYDQQKRITEQENRPHDEVLLHDMELMQRHIEKQDAEIKGLGDVLRRIKRDTDIVGRFGGEEFVVVCEQTDEEGGKNLAERIRRELENTTFQTELGPISVTCSVGVAPFPVAGQDWAQLFKATDEALYVSKRSGRNQVTVWSPRLRATSAA